MRTPSPPVCKCAYNHPFLGRADLAPSIPPAATYLVSNNPPLIGADKYVVLSGQHTVLALQLKADEYKADGLTVPSSLRSILTVVQEPKSPRPLRELASMDAQTVHG